MNKPDTRGRAPVASVVVPVRNGARVVGASAARSDRICLTDGDDVVAPDRLGTMVEHTDDHAIGRGSLVDLDRPGTTHLPAAPPESWSVPFAFGGNVSFARPTNAGAGGFAELGVAAGRACWNVRYPTSSW